MIRIRLIAAGLLLGWVGGMPAAGQQNAPPTTPSDRNDFDSVDQFFGGAEAEDVVKGADASEDALEETFIPGGSSAPDASTRSDDALDLASGFEPARQLALLHQRPLVVVFGAHWCVWCRKLEGELASSDAEEIRRNWVVTKVDVDEEPQLAQQMDVGTLPAIRIVDTSGDVVASRSGFVESAPLQTWLDEHAEQADPRLQQVLVASGVPSATEIDELATMLQRRNPSIRAAASRRLEGHRSATAGKVVDLLRTGSLGGQLMALEILESWGAPVDGIDPWIPATLQSTSLEPLLGWLREIPEHDGDSDQDRVGSDELDPEIAAQRVRDLLDAPAVRRQEIAEQAVSGGIAVAEHISLILHQSDALRDEQRQLLREVRYRILAGPTTRLESIGLLESIASLDAPRRRAAARKLVQTLTSQDQPLIDELSRDSDSLVRELAVAAQSQVGVLTEKDRLQRLLADESPSVRTAVLRHLSESPTDEVTASLVDYLKTESDEDLLVYATKTLGQLAANEVAADALAELMHDSRWRVRAAALDACQQHLGGNGVSSWSSGLFAGGARTLPPSLSAAVLEALDDEDSFVQSKAATTLPHILHRDTAAAVANYMLEDDDHFSLVYESVEEYQRERQLKPLTNLAVKWINGDEPAQEADGARMLARVAPTEMRSKLAELLESPHRPTRVAALQGLLACLREFREQRVGAERDRWKSRVAPQEWSRLVDAPLMHPVPESFAPPDVSENVASEDVASEDVTAEDASLVPENGSPEASLPTEETNQPEGGASIDVVDDFFGEAPAQPRETTEDRSEEETGDESEVESDPSDVEPNGDRSDEGGGVFGWAFRMLGGRSAASGEGDTQGLDSAEAGGATHELATDSEIADDLDSERIGLTAYWLERWQDQDDSVRRPSWLQQCEPLVDGLIDSDDPVERSWAEAAWLACGYTDRVPDLIERLESETPLQDAPRWLDIISWLPDDERLSWLQKSEVAWTEPNDPSWERLKEAMRTDHTAAAGWLYDQIDVQGLEDDESLSALTQLIIQAMLGEESAQELAHPTGDDWEVDSSRMLSHPSGLSHPGQPILFDWVTEAYPDATSDEQRAVLLATLTFVSRRHAGAEALVILEQAEQDSLLTRVATAVALSDLRQLAAARATVLLSHPIDVVAEAALSRLVSIDHPLESLSGSLPISAVGYETPRDFVFQQQPPTVLLESLSRFPSGAETRVAAFADALRLAAGEPIDPDDVLRRLSNWELALPLVAVSLAKAGHSDDGAVKIYATCVENVESHQLGALYRALRPFKDERVVAVRRQLLRTGNGFLP